MLSFLSTVAAQFTASSLVAILISTLAAMVIGAVYYSVFGKAWQAAAKLDESTLEATRAAKTYVIAALSNLILATALFGVAWHISYSQIDLRTTLISGGFIWLGFVMTTMMVNHRFQGRSFALTWIDGGHWFFVIAIQSLIIGLIA